MDCSYRGGGDPWLCSRRQMYRKRPESKRKRLRPLRNSRIRTGPGTPTQLSGIGPTFGRRIHSLGLLGLDDFEDDVLTPPPGETPRSRLKRHLCNPSNNTVNVGSWATVSNHFRTTHGLTTRDLPTLIPRNTRCLPITARRTAAKRSVARSKVAVAKRGAAKKSAAKKSAAKKSAAKKSAAKKSAAKKSAAKAKSAPRRSNRLVYSGPRRSTRLARGPNRPQ